MDSYNKSELSEGFIVSSDVSVSRNSDIWSVPSREDLQIVRGHLLNDLFRFQVLQSV